MAGITQKRCIGLLLFWSHKKKFLFRGDIKYSCNGILIFKQTRRQRGKPVRGYRRGKHNIWKGQYGTEITEQHLCDQARMIRKNEWITKLVDTENLGEEEKAMTQDILDLMKENGRIELVGFNKISRFVLAELSRKTNCILQHIRTENIADTNILIKKVIDYVGKKIGFKAC